MKKCTKTVTGNHNFLSGKDMALKHDIVDKIGTVIGRMVPVCSYCGIIDDRLKKKVR